MYNTDTMTNTMTNNTTTKGNTMTNLITDSALANISTLANSATLVELSISPWNASRSDKSVTQRVATDAGVTVDAKKAGNYRKFLLPDCKPLLEIKAFVGALRNHHLLVTSPWSNNGIRLLANSFLIEYNAWYSSNYTTYFNMVDDFVARYPDFVDGARFALGDLFDATEYPCVTEVRNEFSMSLAYYNVPVAGNFLIDTANAARDQVIDIVTRSAEVRLAGAMRESWDKLHTALSNMSKKLADADDGGKQIFRDSLLGNAHELVSLLSHLNFAKDPALDQATTALRQVLMTTDVKSLRSDDDERRHVKAKVDDILSKFNF